MIRLRAATVALALSLAPALARADDPACAAASSRSRLSFTQRGEVDFGPGFTGDAGSATLGIRYNFLLLGDYDWVMPGTLNVRWPPVLTASATGDPMGGRLTVQYGLRLQFWLRLFGGEFMIPVPMWAGVDRSERGSSMFTPWAWDPMPTAVRVTAHERLLRMDYVSTSVGVVNYAIYGSYELTTTVRTREISFPQAMTSITEMTPDARLSVTANGDMDLPTRWLGSLRYVGALRLRVEVEYPVPGVGIRRRDTIFNEPIPFASRSEQQMSVDRNVRLSMPGAEVNPGFELNLGTVRLGLSGREVITLRNPGTATVAFTPVAPMDTHFQVATDPLCVVGGASRQLSVRFVPDRPGHFESELVLRTTAPSAPEVRVRLVADVPDTSRDGGVTPTLDGGARDAAIPVDDAGVEEDVPPADKDAATGPMDADDGLVESAPACNCRVPGGAPRMSGRGLVAGLALAAFALGRRRRATDAR